MLRCIPWSNRELQFLKKHYAKLGKYKIKKLLKRRTIKAIEWKVIELQLKRNPLYVNSAFNPEFIKRIKETEKAYMAGFFDGEGSIMVGLLCAGIRRNTLSTQYALKIQCTNLDKKVIDLFHTRFGGSISEKHKVFSGIERIYYGWTLHCKKAAQFLELLYPYLTVKKKRAYLAIKFQSKITHTRKKLSDKELHRRNKLVKQIKFLNGQSKIHPLLNK